MARIGDDADLGAGKADGFFADALNRHRHERDRDLFARRKEHVHFARPRMTRDLGSQFHQFIRLVPPRTDDHDNIKSAPFRVHSPLSGLSDFAGVGDTGSAEFLNDDHHGKNPLL